MSMANQTITTTSSSAQASMLQHPAIQSNEISFRSGVKDQSSSTCNDNFSQQFSGATSQSMQFYQGSKSPAASVGQHQNQHQHAKSTQHSYSSTSYYTYQGCDDLGLQIECAGEKLQASTKALATDVTYLINGSENHSPPASTSPSSSSSNLSSTSVTVQQNHHYGHDHEYQQQLCQDHSQSSRHQQQQQEFKLVQQVSSQIDHQSTISDGGRQQLIDEQYSYNYKNPEDDFCTSVNWNNMLENHTGSSFEASIRLEPNSESANQHRTSYGHHLSNSSLHKSHSTDLQDFNNNQEQDYQTSAPDGMNAHSTEQSQQDDYINQTSNQEQQLYTSASYFTNSSNDNYHNHEHNNDHNIYHNLRQSEAMIQPLPAFETIDENNQRDQSNMPVRESIQVQYSSRSSNYDRYSQAEEQHIHSYQEQQQQQSNNLKSSLEGSHYHLQIQNHDHQHLGQHQHQAQWHEQPPVSQEHLVSPQNCALPNQHTFIDGHHHEGQYVSNKQQPPYESLQQLTMNCHGFTNQVSTTTATEAACVAPDGVPQPSSKTRALKGRRGRPRKKGLRSKNKVNGKLWEFIRDLLLSDRTNPSFIRWERREDGVFKFVQSDKVAKMWGERKQNPKMTYEKLSRAMRYYYKSKVLLPVFGRRLVYKFGPNATGWLPTPGDTV